MSTWAVVFGESRRVYYTRYHAEQFAEALRRNGTPYVMEVHNNATV